MDIVIDFTPLQEFFSLPPSQMLFIFFIRFGWLIFAFLFLAASRILWLKYVQGKWFSGVKFIFLAIDIPRGNIQSPRAVENMFSYLAGAHSTQNFFEKWFLGEGQLSFSLEIISSEGYTQFLIRTPEQFRNLVESAIYSQYPDAEIVEVDDYCEGFPNKFPNEEYDVWGTEFIQGSHYMYPIKTYKEFEHQFGPDETVFRDPMAELMELCSSLRKGEHLWYQIILIPTGFDWTDDGLSEINKILGEAPKTSFLNKIIDSVIDLISDLSEMIFSLWGDVESKTKEFKKLSMMELTPKQKKKIEGIEIKSSKLGFLCKIRVVYMAKKEVMNKAKVANGFVGYIKQFAALDLNNLKPDLKMTGTKVSYFNKGPRLIRRKNNIVNNYMNRDDWGGRIPFLLNTEELATLWHFPIEATANAPLIQKTPAKKYKPPANLVSEDASSNIDNLKEELLLGDFSKQKLKNNNENNFDNQNSYKQEQEKTIEDDTKGSPPANLPLG
ncbi:MAG TPA: hypothetical protein PK686_00590 [bacterium]|nr:hypothetical protein [bacterium]HPV65166.1 hypothetical protein [bacterium]